MFKKFLSLFFVLLLSSVVLAQEETPEATSPEEWTTLISHTNVQLSYPPDWFASSDTDGVTMLTDAPEIGDSNYAIFLIEPLFLNSKPDDSLLDILTFGLNNVRAPFDVDDIPYEELDLDGREAILVFWKGELANRAMIALRFTDKTVALIDVNTPLPLHELTEDMIGIAKSFDISEFDPEANPDELVNNFKFENGVHFMYPANMNLERAQDGVVLVNRPGIDLILTTAPFIVTEGTVALQAILDHGMHIVQLPVEGVDYTYEVLDFEGRTALAFHYERDRLVDGMVFVIRMSDGTIGLVDVVYTRGQLAEYAPLLIAIFSSFDSNPDDALEQLPTAEEEEALNANWRDMQTVEATQEAGD